MQEDFCGGVGGRLKVNTHGEVKAVGPGRGKWSLPLHEGRGMMQPQQRPQPIHGSSGIIRPYIKIARPLHLWHGHRLPPGSGHDLELGSSLRLRAIPRKDSATNTPSSCGDEGLSRKGRASRCSTAPNARAMIKSMFQKWGHSNREIKSLA